MKQTPDTWLRAPDSVSGVTPVGGGGALCRSGGVAGDVGITGLTILGITIAARSTLPSLLRSMRRRSAKIA
ncbi:hypothetical protein GCM10018790_07940 [Kitasatospora xanthocidica]|nr:hypothetical protein GCM10018790_07940 [Kitasatospora xanthocidica]